MEFNWDFNEPEPLFDIFTIGEEGDNNDEITVQNQIGNLKMAGTMQDGNSDSSDKAVAVAGQSQEKCVHVPVPLLPLPAVPSLSSNLNSSSSITCDTDDGKAQRIALIMQYLLSPPTKAKNHQVNPNLSFSNDGAQSKQEYYNGNPVPHLFNSIYNSNSSKKTETVTSTIEDDSAQRRDVLLPISSWPREVQFNEINHIHKPFIQSPPPLQMSLQSPPGGHVNSETNILPKPVDAPPPRVVRKKVHPSLELKDRQVKEALQARRNEFLMKHLSKPMPAPLPVLLPQGNLNSPEVLQPGQNKLLIKNFSKPKPVAVTLPITQEEINSPEENLEAAQSNRNGFLKKDLSKPKPVSVTLPKPQEELNSPPETPPPRKKRCTNADRNNCLLLHELLQRHKFAHKFGESTQIANFIKNPKSMKGIQRDITKGNIKSVDEYEAELYQMFMNAYMCNAPSLSNLPFSLNPVLVPASPESEATMYIREIQGYAYKLITDYRNTQQLIELRKQKEEEEKLSSGNEFNSSITNGKSAPESSSSSSGKKSKSRKS